MARGVLGLMRCVSVRQPPPPVPQHMSPEEFLVRDQVEPDGGRGARTFFRDNAQWAGVSSPAGPSGLLPFNLWPASGCCARRTEGVRLLRKACSGGHQHPHRPPNPTGSWACGHSSAISACSALLLMCRLRRCHPSNGPRMMHHVPGTPSSSSYSPPISRASPASPPSRTTQS